MIPNEAIEAAHKAWREQAALDGSIFEYNLRAALEAAAPHMLAEGTGKMVHMSEKTHWEITYYGTGMSPQVASFDNEAEALATWEDWKADPYKGASSIKRVTLLDKA